MKKYLAIALLLTTAGCTSTHVTYNAANGYKIDRYSLLQKVEFNLVLDTNGTASLTSYANDGGNDAIAKITAAAINAAVQATKP